MIIITSNCDLTTERIESVLRREKRNETYYNIVCIILAFSAIVTGLILKNYLTIQAINDIYLLFNLFAIGAVLFFITPHSHLFPKERIEEKMIKYIIGNELKEDPKREVIYKISIIFSVISATAILIGYLTIMLILGSEVQWWIPDFLFIMYFSISAVAFLISRITHSVVTRDGRKNLRLNDYVVPKKVYFQLETTFKRRFCTTWIVGVICGLSYIIIAIIFGYTIVEISILNPVYITSMIIGLIMIIYIIISACYFTFRFIDFSDLMIKEKDTYEE